MQKDGGRTIRLDRTERHVSLGAEVPDTRVEATARLTAAVVRGEVKCPLDGEGLAQSRLWLKRLRRWDDLTDTARVHLWHEIGRFLVHRFGTDASQSPATEPPRPVTVKTVDELRPSQREDLALRRKAAHLLAQGLAPAAILRQINDEDGVTRHRGWVYKVKARASAGDVAMSDRRTSNRRPRVMPVAASLLVEECQYADTSRPTISGIHAHIAEKLHDTPLRTPSRSWVRKELRVHPQQELFRTLGPDEARRQTRPIDPTRDASVVPGQIFEVDSTELDVWIRVVDRHGEPRAIRPWLTVVLDVGSRAVVGLHLTIGAVSEASVFHAVANAFLEKLDPAWPMSGMPRVLRFDRGSEYGRRFRATMGALGIDCDQGRPGDKDERAKVERFFLTLRNFIVGLEGATKALGTDAERVHRALPNLLTATEFLDRLRNWVVRLYHARRHAGLNDIPLAAWATGNLAAAVTPEQLRALLPHERELKVKHGQLQVQEDGVRYTLTGPALVDFPEARVRIRWGGSLDHVALFDIASNRYLGDAVSLDHPQASEYGESLRTLRAEGCAIDRSLRAQHRIKSKLTASVSRLVAGALAEPEEPTDAEPWPADDDASDRVATRATLQHYLRTGTRKESA